jgi:hypothetical protein
VSDESAPIPDLPPAAVLPSDRPRPGSTQQTGFQAAPSQEHVERSAEAARTLAGLVTAAASPASKPLRVRLCLVRLPQRLPFQLYGFHVLEIDERGEFVDEVEGFEITYAIVSNQPVELQRETTVAFLNDLVGRQGPLADIVAGRRQFADLPALTAVVDAASAEAASDTLRFSIGHAADALKTRAAGLGYRLEVRFELDPLPLRDQVARRARQLRTLYDTNNDVRAAVDSTVAILGGEPMAIRGRNEEVRAWTQRHTALLGVRQFMNHTIRDAEVTGNGFLEFGFRGLDPTLRCLRPESVNVLGDEHFAVDAMEGPRDTGRVMHLRGVEQFDSKYGISPLEPLLYELRQRQVILSVAEMARVVAASRDASEEVRRRSETTVRVTEALQRETERRMEQLMWFPRRRLRDVREDLYFSGQECFQA